MGIFWDILQQDELDKQQEKSKDLEGRVTQLEADLEHTRVLLKKTLVALETHLDHVSHPLFDHKLLVLKAEQEWVGGLLKTLRDE